jgi:5S rRNA maturation endonuclease (ribonuclease M5)
MNSRSLEDLERLERVEDVISELQTLSENGAIVVVEGKRDVHSLRSLGIRGEIWLSSQLPLLEFAELLSRTGKEIVLLTDWDKKGGMTARKIINYLMSLGVMPNTVYFISQLLNIVIKTFDIFDSLSHKDAYP